MFYIVWLASKIFTQLKSLLPYFYKSSHFIHSCVIMINRSHNRHFSEAQSLLSVALYVHSICKCLAIDCWEVSFSCLLLFLEWMWSRYKQAQGVQTVSQSECQHPSYAAMQKAPDWCFEVLTIECNLLNVLGTNKSKRLETSAALLASLTFNMFLLLMTYPRVLARPSAQSLLFFRLSKQDSVFWEC